MGRREETHLRIQHDPFNSLLHRTLVNKRMAHPVRMAHHRNLRLLLDPPHELFASAGHDEVDEPVLVEQARYVLARGDGLDEFPRKGG